MSYIRNFKKFIWFDVFLTKILIFCLLIVALPLSAQASESDGISWELSGGTLTVSGNGAMRDFSNNYLPPWYEQREGIQEVVISDGLISVGNYAFYDCKNMTKVTIGNSIQKIGMSAFEGCESLINISFPESLGTLEYHAFYGCRSLTSVHLPYNAIFLGKGVFAYCTSLVTATIEGPMVALPAWTFYGCTSLKTVNLPDTLRDIGEDAFENVPVVEDMYEESETHKQEVLEPVEMVPDFSEIPESNVTNSSTITEMDTQIITPGVSDKISEKEVQVTNDYFEQPNASVSSTVKKVQEGSQHYGTGQVKPDGSPKNIYLVDLYVVIRNMDGWKEIISRVSDFAKYPERLNNEQNEVAAVEITVEMKGEGLKVSSDFLKMLAGLPVKVTFHNSSGMIWCLYCEDYTAEQISKDFLLEYTLEVLNDKSKDQKAITGFQSTYEIKFHSNCPLKFSIKLPVGVSYMNYDAALYKKEDNWKRIQLSKVDNLGNTEFYLDTVKKSDKYMFFLDVSSPYADESLIPDSMKQRYGNLMDEYGNKYAVTGSNSSWGMSGLQVTLIMAAVIIGTVLIVGITVGIISRKKYEKLDADYYKM